MTRLFLFPLLLALAWLIIVLYWRIPWTQGKRGLYWILGVSGGLASTLALMMWLTSG